MNRPGITRQSFLRAGALSFLGATHLDLLRLAGSAGLRGHHTRQSQGLYSAVARRRHQPPRLLGR